MVNKKGNNRGKSPGSAAQYYKEGGPPGNLKGRPKGSPNRHAIIRKILDQTISGEVAGRKRKIRVTEGALLQLAKLALEGDRRSIIDVLALWKETEDALETERGAQYPFSDKDREVIDAVYSRMNASEP